jgi:hypothetical protein
LFRATIATSTPSRANCRGRGMERDSRGARGAPHLLPRHRDCRRHRTAGRWRVVFRPTIDWDASQADDSRERDASWTSKGLCERERQLRARPYRDGPGRARERPRAALRHPQPSAREAGSATTRGGGLQPGPYQSPLSSSPADAEVRARPVSRSACHRHRVDAVMN